MNKVFLIGRLTRDPELRYTGSNIPVATFSIAVDRTYNNANGEKETDFINIVVWRKQAENIKNYLGQGSQVAIDGRLQIRSYDDQNGQKRYVTEVVADNVQFLDTKASREQRSSITNNYNNNMPTSNVTPYDMPQEIDVKTSNLADDPFKDFGEEIRIEDNELPF